MIIPFCLGVVLLGFLVGYSYKFVILWFFLIEVFVITLGSMIDTLDLGLCGRYGLLGVWGFIATLFAGLCRLPLRFYVLTSMSVSFEFVCCLGG